MSRSPILGADFRVTVHFSLGSIGDVDESAAVAFIEQGDRKAALRYAGGRGSTALRFLGRTHPLRPLGRGAPKDGTGGGSRRAWKLRLTATPPSSLGTMCVRWRAFDGAEKDNEKPGQRRTGGGTPEPTVQGPPEEGGGTVSPDDKGTCRGVRSVPARIAVDSR